MVNDTEKVAVRHSGGAVQPLDNEAGELDFSTTISGKTEIKIYGASRTQDITQRIY